MSFGSVTSAMNKTVKDNRALLRGRDNLFDREVIYTIKYEKRPLPPAAPAVRQKFKRQLVAERRCDRIGWVIVLLITGGILGLCWLVV